MDWSAADYRRFEDERTRPARDLLAQVPTARVAAAVDLGCGPGNSTELLRARFPEARLVGIDSSPDMIAAARQRLPDVRFEVADIAAWEAAGPLRPRLRQRGAAMAARPCRAAAAAPGAGWRRAARWRCRCPTTSTSRLHVADARDGGGRALGRASSPAPPRRGRRATTPAGTGGCCAARAARVEVWRTVYHHPLPGGARGVVDWLRATGLRPFLAPLDEDERQRLPRALRGGAGRGLPRRARRDVLLPFPRLFLVAMR